MAASDPAAKVQDIQGDLQQLRDDVAQLAKQMTALLSASGEEALDEVKARVRKARDQVDGAVADAGERGREMFEDVSDSVGAAIEESLRERPLTTIGLALGLGFLFGTAWRR